MLLLKSTIFVSRMAGAGGANCQWMIAWPAAVAQKPTWAIRNICWSWGGGWSGSGQPDGQLIKAPEANANEPGATATPRKLQGLGPLQTSFCRVASKTDRSPVTVLVCTQLVPIEDTLAFCCGWEVEVK